jgi:lysophospholipase
MANETFIDSSQTVLNLLDGGEDGQILPLQPLLVKAREVDVIISIDAVSVGFHLRVLLIISSL